MLKQNIRKDAKPDNPAVVAAETEPDCLLRAADLQDVLGLSRAKIYRLMQNNVLPTVRIGGSIRVPRKALAKWIEQHTLPSRNPGIDSELPTDSVLTRGV